MYDFMGGIVILLLAALGFVGFCALAYGVDLFRDWLRRKFI